MNPSVSRQTFADQWSTGPLPNPPKLQLHKPLAAALSLLCVFYFYSGFGGFIFNRGIVPVTPGEATFLLVGGGAVVGVLALAAGQRVPWGIIVTAGLYLLLIAVNSAFNAHDPTMARDRAAFMLALVSCLFVFGTVQRFDHVVTAMQLLLVGACLLNAVDYFARGALPVQMSEINGRAGGLHINPNTSAAYIALAVPIVCGMASRKVALALYATTFMGVALTFSRSGILLWLTAVVMTELFVRNRRQLGARLVALGIAVAFVSAVLILAGHAIVEGLIQLLGDYLPASLRGRLLFDVHDFAAEQRRYGALSAWRLFTAEPLTGAGLGFDGRWIYGELSHNMVLQTLAEFGVLGGAWISLFVLCLWRIGGPFGLTLTVLWLLNAMFSHNLFDQIAMAVLIAIYWTGAVRSRHLYDGRSTPPAERMVSSLLERGIVA